MSEQIKYEAGLPFDVDYKRMFEKTVENRFHNSNEYLSQLVKLGLLNASSQIDIKNKYSNISVEFETQTKLDKDEFENSIHQLYGGDEDSIAADGSNLKNLGITIAAALASKPKEIVIEVNGKNNNAYRMVIDSSFKPVITTLDKPVQKAKITVIKDSTSRPVLFAKSVKDIFKADIGKDLLEEVLDGINGGLENTFLRGMDFDSRKTILESSKFSELDVNLNGRKISQGLTLDDKLYEQSYTLDDGSTAVLSYPKKHFSYNKQGDGLRKTYLVKGNILVSSPITEDIVSHNGADITIPDIILKSDKMITTMSKKGFNTNSVEQYSSQLENLINEFSTQAYLDLIYSKKDDEEFDFESWQKRAAFSGEVLKNSGVIQGNYTNSETLRLEHKKGPNETERELTPTQKKLKQAKIIQDSTGKGYSVEQFRETIEKNGEFYYTRKNKRVKGRVKRLGIETPVFLFEKSRTSANSIINGILADQDDSNINFKKGVLEDLIDSLDREEQREFNAKKEKFVDNSKTVSKWTLGPTSVGAGTYFATPYIISAGAFAADFLFVDNLTTTGLAFGAAATIGASVYGTSKAVPYVTKVIEKAVKVVETKLESRNERKGVIQQKREEKENLEKKIEIVKKVDIKDECNPKVILKYLKPEERKYVKTLTSIINDFNSHNSNLVRTLEANPILKVKKFKNTGFQTGEWGQIITIDCYSDNFKQNVQRYSEGDFSVFVDQIQRYAKLSQKIKSTENNSPGVPHFIKQQQAIDLYLQNEIMHLNRENMIGQFFNEQSQFQNRFSQLNQNEQQNLIKILINTQGETDAPHEQWLFDNYEREIDNVSDLLISKSEVNYFKNLYDNPNTPKDIQMESIPSRMFNLTSQEKIEVLKYIHFHDSKRNDRLKIEIEQHAPELVYSHDHHFRESTNCESLLRELKKKDLYPTDINFNQFVEENYNEGLFRKTIRVLGDFIPEQRKSVGGILY